MDVVDKRYRYVAVPTELLNQVDQIIEKNKELGYVSASDFVRDAVREKILSLRRGGLDG